MEYDHSRAKEDARNAYLYEYEVGALVTTVGPRGAWHVGQSGVHCGSSDGLAIVRYFEQGTVTLPAHLVVPL